MVSKEMFIAFICDFYLKIQYDEEMQDFVNSDVSEQEQKYDKILQKCCELDVPECVSEYVVAFWKKKLHDLEMNEVEYMDKEGYMYSSMKWMNDVKDVRKNICILETYPCISYLTSFWKLKKYSFDELM